jgi:heme exporter protein C
MACLFVTLWKYELASKHATFRLRALKRKLAASEDELWAATERRSAAPTL